MYGRFLSIVAQSRHKTPQQVDQIAQGRVWDGGTAHQLGLVDAFGGINEAIAKAAQLAGSGNERGVRYLEPQRTFRDQLIEALAQQNDGDSAAPPTPSRRSRGSRSSSCRGARERCDRSCPGRASRRAASSARRSRRRVSTSATSAARFAQAG